MPLHSLNALQLAAISSDTSVGSTSTISIFSTCTGLPDASAITSKPSNLGANTITNDNGIQRKEGVKSVAPPLTAQTAGQRGVAHEDTSGAIEVIFQFRSRS